jgi:Fe-Mn family superoxide dismutase
MENAIYELPRLPYGLDALKPHISEEQLRIHYEKHHKAYVDGANAILRALQQSRSGGSDPDMKAALKSLSFNVGGHVMHSLFWKCMAPEGSGGKPGGKLADLLARDFGSFDRFRKEFSLAAAGVEGSGWAALSLCPVTGRLLITQIEKHNTNLYPSASIILALDVFEHAYYLDYRNDRARFIEAFWKLADWNGAGKRLDALRP